MSVHGLTRSALTLAAAVALAACSVSGPLTARDTVVETRTLSPEGRFGLENVNGRIFVDGWSRSEVRIQAERAAASEWALERLRVEIDGEGDEVRVRTRQPRTQGLWPFGGGGRVHYSVSVPAGARVRLTTVNGPVDVRDLAGELRVESVNGALELRGLRGEVRASTVNGGIHARFDRVPAGGHHRFSTVNGGIEIRLPEGTGGRLEARTANGGIDCDLPLEASEKTRRRLEGRLGPGGGSFEISTVNGGIDLLRAAGPVSAEAELP